MAAAPPGRDLRALHQSCWIPASTRQHRKVALRNGWFWVIPVGGESVSVGLVIDSASYRESRLEPERALLAAMRSCPELRRRTEQARRVSPVPSTSNFCTQPAQSARLRRGGRRVRLPRPDLLVGRLATAMLGGRSAARVVDRCLAEPRRAAVARAARAPGRARLPASSTLHKPGFRRWHAADRSRLSLRRDQQRARGQRVPRLTASAAALFFSSCAHAFSSRCRPSNARRLAADGSHRVPVSQHRSGPVAENHSICLALRRGCRRRARRRRSTSTARRAARSSRLGTACRSAPHARYVTTSRGGARRRARRPPAPASVKHS